MLVLEVVVQKMNVKSSICYSASYMIRTRDQKRFTVLEVAADWHELMIPQCAMRPSIARLSEQLDPRFAASRHTTASVSHTMHRSVARSNHYESNIFGTKIKPNT